MRKRFLVPGLVSLAAAAFLLGCFFWWVAYVGARTEVVFLNVGQGDAILISQGMNQVLVDSGRSGKELLARLGRHMPFWDRHIEAVIATHPDGDHIGGFVALLHAYEIGQVLYTGAESDTETSKLFQAAIAEHVPAGPLKIFRGASLKFPAGGELMVEYPLAPLPKEMKDTNSGSIVARFVYGGTSLLLTGDLPYEETVLSGENPVTILKAAHHGSKYSTSDAFLDLVRPHEAVISVGKNSYGHPAPEVLERLEKHGVQIHRTDLEGDVVYRCFGERCVLEK